MAGEQAEVGSHNSREVMEDVYGETLLKCMDLTGRDDFYGIVARGGIRFFGEQLGLTRDSHLLDLGSGVGGPARYFAATYGCRVTGVELSEFNVRTARQRAGEAGLDHLVSFLHGDALEVPYPREGFTHVFGCEAWCYFPDKVRLYEAAYRALKPGGVIAFLEAACETPVRLIAEAILAPVRYESIARYTAMLRDAGFEAVQRFDTTQLATRDVAGSLYRLITSKDRVIGSAGAEAYYALVEIWAEFLACFSEGKLTHCGFVARKRREPL
jgi:ubiquinone/menaquinone biosynthesis C-methylase UbiE